MGACPARHWLDLPIRYPAGGAGGGGRPPTLPLVLLLSPSPRPPSPPGKGETIGYFLQGASPLASPRLSLRGTGSPCRCGKLNGGLPRAALARPANPVPGGGRRGAVARRPCRCGVRRGGLPALSPANPAFSLLFCPYPPAPPSPPGKGGLQVIFMQGASPLASPGLNPRFVAKTTGSGSLRGCRRGSTAGVAAWLGQ